MNGASVTVCAPTLGIRNYEFDFGWDAAATQGDVYDSAVVPLVLGLLNGVPACVLTYGQTGSGKTFTMWGDDAPDCFSRLPEAAGLVPRVVAELLSALPARAAAGLRPELRMSCVEIFGDDVTDLLQGGAVGAWQGTAARAVARGDADVAVEGAAHAASLLAAAEANKRRAATAMNERSSRAHTVLQLTLLQHGEGGKAVRSTLTLADLGGCEAVKKSKAAGERMVEAININLGLLALKSVIVALHQGLAYVPYQDDKLTMVLQPSLGGGRTVVLVTGRPEAAHAAETIQALRFGETCSQVEIRASGGGTDNAAAALRTLDAQIESVQAKIRAKERWETRVLTRRDERAGKAATDGAGGQALVYKTDLAVEEYKVSGLFGAETEHAQLERLLQARSELVGA